MPMPRMELEGHVYGDLLVVGPTGERRRGSTLWQTLCECGEERVVSTGELRSGRVSACVACTMRSAARKRSATWAAKRAGLVAESSAPPVDRVKAAASARNLYAECYEGLWALSERSYQRPYDIFDFTLTDDQAVSCISSCEELDVNIEWWPV